MILLDSINAMDTTFTLKDVFYICGLLVSILAGWFKMQNDNDKQQSQITILQEKAKQHETWSKEEFMNATNGRRSIRKELLDDFNKQIQVTHTRIDRVRDDNIKSYEKLERRIDEMDKKSDQHVQTILDAIRNKKS